MNIVIIKYNAGNVQSVQYALKRLGAEALVTADEQLIRQADKVIFPGVGHAGAAMESLQENGLDKVIKSLTQPVLGICVGMQLLCKHSEEGDTNCIGIFDTEVKLFSTEKVKVPQTGWNDIFQMRSSLFKGLNAREYVYFVHSYYAALCGDTAAVCDYDGAYSAALQKDNFYAVQFHAEKSAKAGERIIQNFLNL